jgi:hypothetical protein
MILARSNRGAAFKNVGDIKTYYILNLTGRSEGSSVLPKKNNIFQYYGGLHSSLHFPCF